MGSVHTKDGVEIDWRIIGRGPTNWIFLHGWGSSGEFWADFIENHFDLKSNRAICLSFRGHGLSGRPVEGYTYDQFADDMLAVADAATAGQFILVGFSMGGKFAQFITARHPDRVLGQILIASAGPEELPFEKESTLAFCRSASDARTVRDFFTPWVKHLPKPKLFDGFVASVTRTPAFVLEKTAELLAWKSIAGQVAVSQTPTLIIAGRDDPVYSPDYQQRFVMPYFKKAQLETIPCGHFVPIEMPDALAKAVVGAKIGLFRN